jgi:serine phosphatase RsbU (regulator of sigma subunit)
VKKADNASANAAQLRLRAEERATHQGRDGLDAIKELDAQRLVHELQVHQIELELQNEELRKARDEADAWLELYTDLYDFAPVGYFTLDWSGQIRQVNLTGASLLGVERSRLVGSRFGLFVSPGTRPEFTSFLGRAFGSQTRESCEVAVLTEADGALYVRIESAVSADGEECRIAVVNIAERRRAENVLALAAERSLHIANVLQHALLPSRMPELPDGYEIAARYHPASDEAEVCGDLYDLIVLGGGKIGIVIGDIVGKGLNAAARVAAVKYSIRSYAFLDDRPSSVMTLSNDALFRDLAADNDLLTAFFAVLDTRAGVLRYANAGHEPPLVKHLDGSVEYLTAGGPMFTGIGSPQYNEGSIDIHAGGVLVMLTDGITEARKAGQWEMFGPEGVERSLARTAGASAQQIASGLLADALSFAERSLRDDVAIVVIKKQDAVPPERSPA